MINDQTVRADVVHQWETVRTLSQGVHRTGMASGGAGAVMINETPLDEHFNLPFVLAFAVLDQVLDELVAQGSFACTRWELGAKMLASKGPIVWTNYSLVDEGKMARNKLAHEAKLVSKADALRFIRAIEDELRAWRIL
jgi:hypothetical protein